MFDTFLRPWSVIQWRVNYGKNVVKTTLNYQSSNYLTSWKYCLFSRTFILNTCNLKKHCLFINMMYHASKEGQRLYFLRSCDLSALSFIKFWQNWTLLRKIKLASRTITIFTQSQTNLYSMVMKILQFCQNWAEANPLKSYDLRKYHL